MEISSGRRDFIKKTTMGTAGLAMGMSAKSYANIIGANDRVNVGILGFSGRAQGALIPAFYKSSDKMNFQITSVCDLWNLRREEGVEVIKKLSGNKKVKGYRNTDEMYEDNQIDAVIISTADFQHALLAAEAANAKKDVYCEKPFAETMEDNRQALKAVNDAGIVLQVGSQRRSGANYHAANNFIKSGQFGDITSVEMSWNVNQPGRWRRPKEVAAIKETDTDWKRFLLNRPYEQWDPRKYLEYRLFWPYSSGIPGQWMAHQIDTVHWFTDLPHPRSVAANGGIYLWKDGRKNYDTMTAVFDYGPLNDMSKGFQVVYSSRFTNSAGGTKEIYYSNGGELNLDTNKVTANGGLIEKYAKAMNMKPNLLDEYSLSDNAPKVVTSANTGADDTTSLHMLNWMECIRSRKETNAPVKAGYNHSIANIMTTAALRTGQFVTFDEKNQEVLAGGKVFQY
ncbi:Gfo/Idh/MocA family oxidoreductase [Reichenbachiella sp. MALMAid0571]|uniref:Gfo/Idh/MocA family protein n=1 Tax=Reichenbachiella sp. MALMAid0571 TaxID=3143939 RepID=UPI0032E02533